MFNFDVKDLSECESAMAIVKAVIAVDDEARVFVQLGVHSVEVTSVTAGAQELLGAIRQAGFVAELVADSRSSALASSVADPRPRSARTPFVPDGSEFDSGDA